MTEQDVNADLYMTEQDVNAIPYISKHLLPEQDVNTE
jgi:hypothetical protein